MTKEECETALSKLWDNTFGTDCITGEDLDKYVDIIDGLIQYVFNPQPYKFEELEEGMLVWDNQQKKFIKVNRLKRVIISMNNYKCYIYCDIPIEFEENRFFPITKVNQ